jgi:predicted Zn-dependent peptidase
MRTVLLAFAAVVSPAIALGQAPKPERANLQLDVRREKLDNGLRVVLAPDHTSPTIAVSVVYDVGARNEERGRSGFAHLFEHMMFQGSRNVRRGEHFKLVTGHGGMLNGTTNSDRTIYYEMLPQNELALALWLEADRMKSLEVSEENFDNQRAVVKEEYRMRVENAPYVPAELRLEQLVFQGYWPYEHSPIGTMNDLDAAQLDWVRAFHDAFYAPNGAVLSIAGDFDHNAAMAMVRRYFGDARPQPNVPRLDLGTLPEQTTPRDDVVLDPHATLAAVLLGWAAPPNRAPEHYALELAAMALADGETSRLHRTLVRELGLAIDVSAKLQGHRGPDAFEIECKLAKTAKPADAERRILAEIDALAKSGPTDDEMKKLRARVEARFLLDLQSNLQRARKLAELELFWNDAGLVNTELARYLAVTRAEVQRAALKYLTPARRSLVEVKPQ